MTEGYVIFNGAGEYLGRFGHWIPYVEGGGWVHTRSSLAQFTENLKSWEKQPAEVRSGTFNEKNARVILGDPIDFAKAMMLFSWT